MWSSSTQATTTTYHRYLVLTVLEAERAKVKMPATLAFGEGSLSGLQRTTFLLCPHIGDAEARLVSLLLLIRALNLIMRSLPSWSR